MVQQQDEIRKGPWTEQEDILLVNFVHLFGDRRWDFIAKVSGLNRTGKSCRLRWVNYLHPGLKRGKMSPQEERLVLEFHAKWGNRWSRIARKLPGRTDNEIKNYWRTHMRKKAQEKKRALIMASPSTSSSISSSSSSSNLTSSIDSLPCSSGTTTTTTTKSSFYDTGGIDEIPPALADNSKKNENSAEHENGFYSMDDIWKDIDLSEQNKGFESYNNIGGGKNFACPSMASPTWDYSWDVIWKNLGEEESKKNVMNNIPSDDQIYFPNVYNGHGFGKSCFIG